MTYFLLKTKDRKKKICFGTVIGMAFKKKVGNN